MKQFILILVFLSGIPNKAIIYFSNNFFSGKSSTIDIPSKNYLANDEFTFHIGSSFGIPVTICDALGERKEIIPFSKNEQLINNQVATTNLLDPKWFQTQKLVTTDRRSNVNFGERSAISGDYAIVSAPGADYDTDGNNFLNNSGAVYIFEKNAGGDWIESQKLVASDRQVSALFANAVAIDGNYAVVGAFFEAEDENGMNPVLEAGAVYIYERDAGGTWSEVQKIVASERNFHDQFGYSLSISGCLLYTSPSPRD